MSKLTKTLIGETSMEEVKKLLEEIRNLDMTDLKEAVKKLVETDQIIKKKLADG
jgi:DNA polymerase III delta subunit